MARKPRRTGRADAKGRTTGNERHLRLTHFMLASTAWQSLRPVARALFVELGRRYNGHNNGSIGLGVREASMALHVKPHTVGEAFRELQDRGFIVLVQDSGFDQKRLSREWRITTLPVGDCRAPTSPPSNDYVRWVGPAEKQKPVPKGDTHSAERGYRNAFAAPISPIQYPQTALQRRFHGIHSAETGHTSNYQARAAA
jgi:hypothetical protein